MKMTMINSGLKGLNCNAGLLLVHRLSRRTSIRPALGKRLVSAISMSMWSGDPWPHSDHVTTCLSAHQRPLVSHFGTSVTGRWRNQWYVYSPVTSSLVVWYSPVTSSIIVLTWTSVVYFSNLQILNLSLIILSDQRHSAGRGGVVTRGNQLW